MRRAALLAVFALGFLGWLALATAVQDPVLVRYRVPIEGLEWPLRLVQLSDVHGSGYDMPLVRVQRIVAKVNALSPDLIVMTGDYFGGKVIDLPGLQLYQVINVLDGLTAPLGVVAVAGNHDQSYWISRVFAGTQMRLLRGDFVDLGPLVVAGADSIMHHYSPAIGLRAAIAAAPAGKPLISISHEPETAQYAGARSQLHLSGHTHGGQVVIPGLRALSLGPLSSNPFSLAHPRGLYALGGAGAARLLVSSGLGTTFVPLRLGVPPEIVVVELVPAAAVDGQSVGRNSGTER
jgi:hypothetical protein